MAVNIIQNYATNNKCYTNAYKITVKGLMLHSVGCPQPKASVFRDNWNNSTIEVCVHAIIDGNDGSVLQILPWNYRAWHCGGIANGTHIGVEMCEPGNIQYLGGSNFVCTDKASAIPIVKRTYESAVQLFASLCKQFNLNPLDDGVIISHSEGNSRGWASNHADPEHLWKGLGLAYNMNTFRLDVSNVLNGGNVTTLPGDGNAAGNNTTTNSVSGESTSTGGKVIVVDKPVLQIEPNPDITTLQPIFPFVELSVGDQIISSFDDEFSDTVIDFNYYRKTYYMDTSQAGSKFDITLYDDTAFEVEELLAKNLNSGESDGIEIGIKYGYSRGGEERYMTSELVGSVAKYGLSFESVGLTLTLSGTIRDYSSAAGSIKIAEYPSDEYGGKPSKIVEAICLEEGWDIGYIEETDPVYDDDGSLRTFRRESMSATDFINSMLEYCVSSEYGTTGYQWYIGEDGKGKAYFVSEGNSAGLAKMQEERSYYQQKQKEAEEKESAKNSKDTKVTKKKKKKG